MFQRYNQTFKLSPQMQSLRWVWRKKDFRTLDAFTKRNSKFGNVETAYNGILFRSKLEANYAMFLDSEKRKGRIKSWKYEVAIPLHAKGGKKVGEYQVDFQVEFPDKHIEWHECKGRWTDLARWKVKHCRLEYPNRVLKIIR